MTNWVTSSGRSGPSSLSQERHGFPRTEDCLSDTFKKPRMVPIRSMTVDQFEAVWRSEQFCMLNDNQLAAMGERLERDRETERFNQRFVRARQRQVQLICAVLFAVPLLLPLTLGGLLHLMSATSVQTTEVR